jgi:ADP-heptose:LPS heptosyltransferase
MAAAFGLPVVVIFGDSNIDVWRPWKTASAALSSPDGIASISTEQVLTALARLRVHA